jgi:hypothetical protein
MGAYTVTTSAELMENYIQADFLLPQDKFTALQTDAGASLLFSIGTGGAFKLTIEQPGQKDGWRQVDLGAARIQADFGGKATVKTFGAAQHAAARGGPAAEIHLAMVVNDGTNDHLYLSLANSDADLAWADKPDWTAAPFNAVDSNGQPIVAPSPFQIANVFLSEATDKEYIVVDTIRNPGQPVGMLTRYYIDGSAPAAPKWQPHDLAVDVQATGYDSCLGRSAQAYGVDGLYTKGIVGSAAQLVYTPLYNAFDPSMPPLPSRLNLPGGLTADAIAAARNADNSSDLYAAAQGGLYWFASGNQKDGAVGVLVASNPLLAAVRSLYACVADGAVTVWGLNGNDQVFYLSCPLGHQWQSGSWNVPLPVMAGVDAVSPFIDRGYSANTFFAHSGTGLVKLVKSPTTGLWNQRRITLPASAATQPATPIHSYSTHIQVTDANGQAAANVPVTLTATNVTSVYINHLYYIIGPSPIQVPTDALGTVTIVELATTLAGTRFTVAAGSQPAAPVNTMDTAWQRNAQYTSAASLQSAKIVNRDGTTRDFVPAGTSQGDLDRVAYSNQCLAKAYASVASVPAPPRPALRALAAPRPLALAAGSVAQGMVVDGILVDIGDLFRWLESGVEAFVQLIEDAAEGAWHFVVTIGEAVYHAVLDCVEAVVAAATWVYNAIKIAVEDVIKFLEFLFGWQDILVTHKVLKNLFLCLGQYAIDGIDATKVKVAALFQQLQGEINGWAGIPDFNQNSAGLLAANPPLSGQNGAPANLGVHHFQGSCASSSSGLSPLSPAEAIFDDMVKLLEAEGDTLAAAANAIKTDIIEPFSSLSVTDIIKRFLAIVADTVLQSAENVLLTVLDVFKQLMQGMIDALSAKLDIPVLSWLYKELTGEDLSFLDVICLVAAIPVTIIYKAAAQKTPFAAGDAFTQGLIGAKSFAEIQALFVLPSPVVANARPVPMALSAMALAAGADAGGGQEAPVLDQAKLKTFGFVTGIVSLIGGVVLVVVTNIQRLAELLNFEIVYAKTLATIGCIGNIAYVSPNIATLVNARTDNWYANLNNALTGVSILKGMAAIPAAAYDNPTIGKVFAFVETFINIVWNVPVIANIVVNKDTWNTTYKSLIPESIGNFAFNIGGILEFPIAMAKDLKVKGVLIITQAGLMVVYGAFMIIAGSIYQFSSNQEH